MRISIFGTGYVGLVTGACLANLGHEILCVDIDSKKINSLIVGEIPFYEPGLKELVAKNKEKGRLKFSVDVEEGVSFGEVIFNCVGTPSEKNGSADLKYVLGVAESVGKFSKGHKLLINKSTVPPGTAKKCWNKILETNPVSEVEVVSNPEFLKEGSAVYDFTHPDKIVVGAKSGRAYGLLRKVYAGRVRTYIPFLETDWETAEMIKYANNSFLATKICFVNEIANICDGAGADVKLVTQAMGLDYRISPKFLNPGIGYGGSCFPKDVRALINSAEEKGYCAQLLKEVDQLNNRQKEIFVAPILDKLRAVGGNTVTLWGLSFKPRTDDIREATSLRLIKKLIGEGITVKVYDPIAMENVREEFGDSVSYCKGIDDSVEGSDVIVLVTEWDEFRNVNFLELGEKMRNKILFDGRNIYEPELVREEGFEYFGVGRK
ncbi:UDP-glucose/GDP-mannose dehydrogenase family protein [Candidatus Woesearchaeota archaeon]|nr:UDP-glucose/GDP-mannose dehydrogenase family protein [Candidatus Woesearchaeota archaeon]